MNRGASDDMSNKITRVLYRSFLREITQIRQRGGRCPLLQLPIDAKLIGRGDVCEATDKPSRCRALFPTLSLDDSVFPAAENDDFAIGADDVLNIVRISFRNPKNTHDAAFGHLAALNRLRSAATTHGHSITQTSFLSSTVTVEVTTRELCSDEMQRLSSSSGSTDDDHAFVYRIRITNRGQDAVKLMGRAWVFMDDAKRSMIAVPKFSPGVVGLRPVIEPGRAFEYTSYSVIKGPTGRMAGSFDMLNIVSNHAFEAAVGNTPLHAK